MFLGFENYRDIDVLKGKTLVEVERSHYDSNDALFFKTADGEFYIMTHNQDCCENVYIDDICGDFADLLNEEIMSDLLINPVKKSDPHVLTFAPLRVVLKPATTSRRPQVSFHA